MDPLASAGFLAAGRFRQVMKSPPRDRFFSEESSEAGIL